VNAWEYQRITLPSFPSGKESSTEIIQKLNALILNLLKRDEDKERRIRALEAKTKVAGGRGPAGLIDCNIPLRATWDDVTLKLIGDPGGGEVTMAEWAP